MWRLLDWLTRRSQKDLGQESRLPEAKAALQRASADLEKVRAQRPEVDRLAAEFRRVQKENHFGDRLAYAYGLRGPRGRKRE